MKTQDWLVLAGIGMVAFLMFQRPTQAAPPFPPHPGGDGGQDGLGPIYCKYPDGTRVKPLADGTCPYDISHGGQSGVCYPGNEPDIESICFLW